jgi:anti-sigma B factor antagonist
MPVERSQPAPGLAVITIDGEVDYANAHEISDAVGAAIEEWTPRTLCVDLASVVFMDSMGISALITAYRATTASGASFAVVNPSRFTLTLLTVTGLVDVFGLGTQEDRLSGTAEPAG